MGTRAARFVVYILLITPSASADFVGVTTVNKDDPDTEFFCAQGNGDHVPGPLTVCNVYAAFDNPNDVLFSVGNADLQVYNGVNPDVFFQHPLDAGATAPLCSLIDFVAPDLICDTFVTFGYKCAPDPAGTDATTTSGDFDFDEFRFNGHLVGCWFNATPTNGQGVAGTWPDLQVLFLQSSVAQGLSMSGDIDIFWEDGETGETIAEIDVPIECVAVGGCQDPEECDDNNACTEDNCVDGVCENPKISCPDDGNECTDTVCDRETGCGHVDNENSCDNGDPCTINDVCSGGSCTAGEPLCLPGEECVDGECIINGCPEGELCDDGDACTEGSTCDANGECGGGTPIDCPDDGNDCTDAVCDPAVGCTHTPNNDPCDDGDACTVNDKCGKDGCVHGTPVQCPKGQVCDPANGKCIEADDPCECVNGRVTLCHIPPGNPDNAHTITVGCAARDRHLAHGDACGPCEDGGG